MKENTNTMRIRYQPLAVTKRGRLLFTLVLLFSVCNIGKAQQRPVSSTYMFNGLILNPAYAGSLQLFSTTFTNRNQWVNIKGAPVFQSLTAHTTLKSKRVGVGLNFLRDVIGVHETNSLHGSLSYKIRMSKGILSMGLQGGFDHKTSDYSRLTWFDPSEAILGRQTSTHPNFGLGIYFSNKTFFLGASVPYVLTYQILKSNDSPVFGQSSRYYYLTGGLVKALNQDLKVSPSMLLRIQENAPLGFDININFIIKEMIYAGASYRHNDSVSLLFQLALLENFRFGYAYDIPMTGLGRFTKGSHEFFLNYRIKIKFDRRDGLCQVYF